MRAWTSRVVATWFFIHSFAGSTFGQAITVSGLVRDRNTHEEISNVNIYVKSQAIGTTSDPVGRFSLELPGDDPRLKVVFRHIAYEPLEVPIDSLRQLHEIYLQPRIIPLLGVTVEEEGLRRLEIDKDLPQTVSVIDARSFQIRGYVDAGDLLRTDHSVQVEEELSGKKTASIRGGNPDDVVVLYNGIKMNSAYDNIFDLSLIDLEDIARFEIIKGSNTALYGPEAFSGVINIVPKLEQDYNVRFQQRLGTYRSGNWGLHLYQKLHRFRGSYSFKRGGAKRNFIDTPTDNSGLENTSLHHTANLSYSFSERADGRPANTLGAMYIYSSLEYENRRDSESLSNLNQMASLKYSGHIGDLRGLGMSVSLRRLEEGQFLVSETNALSRTIKERAVYIKAEKRFDLPLVDLLFGYQFQHAELDFSDRRSNIGEEPVGLQSAELQRQHHGLVSIAKLHGETTSTFLQTIDVDLSVRYDRVRDREFDPVLRGGDPAVAPDTRAGLFGGNDWQETMFKFALNLLGYRRDLAVDGYLSFGINTKFPSLFQQVSLPAQIVDPGSRPNLNPEKSRSTELSVVLTRDLSTHRAIYGWQISGSFFQNHYDNKFRVSATPGVPVPFYDNVPDARITGIETESSIFLFRKKVTLELGLSRYFISEKAAFPFKSDIKRTFNLIVDHAGYSFQLHWFKEGEQVGWLRQQNGRLAEVFLPDYSNLDLHLGKTFRFGRLKLFANASGRNLLADEDVVLQGLAIRDRRYYLTLGAQY